MSSVQLELGNPAAYSSVKEYIEQHVTPVLTELHRLTNEMIAPGSTAEAGDVDMISGDTSNTHWASFTTPLKSSPKFVKFDGSEYFKLPKDLLKAKQVKIQLTATVYCRGDIGTAEFALFDGEGGIINGSVFSTSEQDPSTITRRLPFGEAKGLIAPSDSLYLLKGRPVSRGVIPVCRRFSLSFIYI